VPGAIAPCTCPLASGTGSVSSMPTLLVVEDDAPHRRSLRVGLSARGYDVVEAADGRSARAAVEARRPDLVLLDLGLPDIDGVDLCRHLRLWPAAPIIVVSAESDDRRMVEAFGVGADDYVVKPVVMDVLAARIAVHLRYAEQLAQVAEPEVIKVGAVTIDLGAHAVRAGDVQLDLRPQQFTVLEVLMRHAGRLVTHEMLARSLGKGSDAADRKAIRIAVHRLRTVLGEGAGLPRVVTEHHVGYRLVPPE
jgi:two-component system KDP operon response regulator KdpE